MFSRSDVLVQREGFFDCRSDKFFCRIDGIGFT